MSKKTGVVVAVLGICALSVFLVNCGSSSSRPAGLLYVLSQQENNVSSYSIDLDTGFLDLITENLPATCPTAPCGLPVSISLDPTDATAFVLNQFSISGYTVNSDGSLSSPTTAATFSASPAEPALAMARDAAGAFMFVISEGALPSASDCGNLPVTDATCPSIQVYTTSPGSTSATLASTFLLNRIPTGLSVISFTPQGASSPVTMLFVTSSQDLTQAHNDNELSVYTVSSSGVLTEQQNSPYTTEINPQVALAVNTNPAGQATGGIFVYVGNQGSVTGSVSVFQVCTVVQQNSICTPQNVSDLQLIPVGNPATVGITPSAMIVDPTNSFLYVACSGQSQVYAFHMVTGTGLLTPLSPASVSTGGTPVSMAMHPNYNAGAQFLYVSNSTGSSVTGFNLAATTGTLTNPQTILFPPGEPSGIAVK